MGKLKLPFADQCWLRFLLGWMKPSKGHSCTLHKVGDALKWVLPRDGGIPPWLCPHRLFNLPVKTMVDPRARIRVISTNMENTSYAQKYTDVGMYYTHWTCVEG
ncbi:hypothetical protein NC651_019183 [Populus alba x Populus x berolinensis]|nr:hypothetical protein NC651_019183 [Populus alba x Populus x berolinensis]